MKEFINEQGLDKYDDHDDRKLILQKFFGNGFYSCLLRAERVGKDFFLQDFEKYRKSKDGRAHLTRKYIKWDVTILKHGQMESTKIEDHAYKMLSYFKHLYSQGKTVGTENVRMKKSLGDVVGKGGSKNVSDFVSHVLEYMSHTMGAFGVAVVVMGIILIFSKFQGHFECFLALKQLF